MAIDALSETVIRLPRSVVSAYAADPDNAPEWYRNIKSVRWVTPKSLDVGARMQFVADFLGRELRYEYEVVEHIRQTRFVMRTAEGPFPMETTYAWEDAGPGETRMTLRNRGEPAGFSRLVTPFMALAVRSANRKDLANLKRILETREHV